MLLVLSSLSCYRSQVRAGVRWDMANLGGEDLRSQEGESFLYFAYGSNLLTERIHLRNPSAVFCSVARLQKELKVCFSCMEFKVICLGAKENGLPLEYQKKLNAIEPNDYKGKVSEEIEDIIKKGEAKTH
ncbi:hypothetical protein E2I00_013841 [Balaenoptera physalus]|uniref:gamma-glutamylcyclotransferase n=1 Tax=Balaenoptera physalus TaxID=9770 RepID=A0A643BLP9_BALPH|nr:hypothetical protein E2I00_013841 [Balaenoptera physalus]